MSEIVEKKRTDDEDSDANDRSKKFKESVNDKLISFQSDVSELKNDLRDIKTNIERVATNVNNSNLEIKEELQSALNNITTTISSLVMQIKDLNERENQREQQISSLEMRINKLEQQNIEKNIEIKNCNNNNLTATEIVKKIADNIKVNINKHDINKAYKLIQREEKIIVEFSSLGKKKEFMNKIDRHRIESKIINPDKNKEMKYIYINDQLTLTNRRLFWSAKTKAKENNWKFVWVRNGNIFAKQQENTNLIKIKNTTDIELIGQNNNKN